MSLSLTLIFENAPIFGTRNNKVLGYDRMHLGDVGRDLEVIMRDVSTPLGIPLWAYGDEGLRLVTEDPYGTPLTFVTAHQLAKAHFTEYIGEPGWKPALKAFVGALPPTTRIILWWS